jgi:hypothetical protein
VHATAIRPRLDRERLGQLLTPPDLLLGVASVDDHYVLRSATSANRRHLRHRRERDRAPVLP